MTDTLGALWLAGRYAKMFGLFMEKVKRRKRQSVRQHYKWSGNTSVIVERSQEDEIDGSVSS